MGSLSAELESIYDQHGRALFVSALAITGNRGLAEDAVHDAFCRAFRLRRRPDNLAAYMAQSVRHAAIDIRRKHRRLRTWQAETCLDVAADLGPSEVEVDEQFRQVLRAMRQLNENEREVVMERLIGDMKFREIAEWHGMPLGTVTALYHRGLKKLKGLLERHDGTD